MYINLGVLVSVWVVVVGGRYSNKTNNHPFLLDRLDSSPKCATE